MSAPIVARIVRESGVPNLLEVLGESLAATDLQSLLLAVFHRRAGRQTPRRVLDQYAGNPFVRPALADARALLDLDRLAFDLAVPAFEPVELAPLAPLGTCSALAPVDQNRVVSTVRNTEVVSDSTNILALECALRRRAQRKEAAAVPEPVRLCASHRLVRAQRYTGPHQRAHFRLFALCTAGRAEGPAAFEPAALTEQLTFYLRFLAALAGRGYRLAGLRIACTPLAGAAAQDILQGQVLDPLAAQFPAARLAVDPDPATTPGYYAWVRFGVYARDAAGAEHMLGDGGFTTWTQQLLGDRRERLLISGLATERIATLFRALPNP